MKLFLPTKRQTHTAIISGFTLVEMMIAVTIFSFVVIAVIAMQLVTMRVYTLGATMLSATTNGRQTMNVLRDEIRACKNVYVGTYDPTNNAVFYPVPNGQPQAGNALEISYTNNAGTNFEIIYQNPSQTNICSFSNNGAMATADTVLANYVTNYYCFYAENYGGKLTTNYLSTPVIHVVLQFYQWEYPVGVIGGNGINSYNSYVLNARVSRRARE